MPCVCRLLCFAGTSRAVCVQITLLCWSGGLSPSSWFNSWTSSTPLYLPQSFSFPLGPQHSWMPRVILVGRNWMLLWIAVDFHFGKFSYSCCFKNPRLYFASVSAKNPFDTSALQEQLDFQLLPWIHNWGANEATLWVENRRTLPLCCCFVTVSTQLKADLLFLWTLSVFFPVSFYF